jgi:hypothetical protein
MASIGGSGGVVVDGHGNVGLTGSLAGGGGTPSAGIGVTVSITTADKMTDLGGLGVEGGISVTPTIVGPSIGVDIVGGKGYAGVNINFGFKGTPIIMEGHGRISGTGIVPLNGLLAGIGNQAKGWAVEQLKDALSKLPDDVKEKIEDHLGMSFEDIIDSITSSDSDDTESSSDTEKGE